MLQLPERIEFVDAMPFTKAEKIDKTALREEIERKLLNNPAASQEPVGEPRS